MMSAVTAWGYGSNPEEPGRAATFKLVTARQKALLIDKPVIAMSQYES